MRKNKKAILVLSIVGLVSCFSINVFGATKLYEKKETEIVTKGVTYENSLRATNAGIQDLHVLTVDITNEYITLGPAISSKEYGVRDNTLNILKDNNAVAGVNGDFFNMSTAYAASLGLEVVDGDILSVSERANINKNELAALYIDNDNNPLINYFKTEILFLNDGERNTGIISINKLLNLDYPAVVNKLAMDDTKAMDGRFPNNLKIVVENDVIVNITTETVVLPENGYIVVIGSQSVDYYKQFFQVGQSAELIVQGGINYHNLQMAIGGGGKVLIDGNTAVDSGLVLKGRHPRTAVGISEDKTKIIILSVDGRGDSIGATHEEMAELLKEYGAYNGMHLDGGGSTTMVASTVENQNLKVVSTPSEGSLRNVINALAVYNNSPDDLPLSELRINTHNGFVNTPITVEAYGLNEAYGRVNINTNNLVYQSDDENGVWKGNVFYPSRVGSTTITVSDENGLVATKVIEVSYLVELRPSKDVISSVINQRDTLSFVGISNKADEVSVTEGVVYELVPPTIGTMENNTFISNGESGYIKATLGNLDTYIGVYATSKTINYNIGGNISFLSYNGGEKDITGGVKYTSNVNDTVVNSIELNYNFPIIAGTQAAYLKFDEPILLNNPSKISLDVYGDNSQNWLRGQIIDSQGNTHIVDFAKNINWNGYNKVTATIPSAATYPVYLSRVYVANIEANESNKAGTIYISNLTGEVPYMDTSVVVPVGSKYVDPINQPITVAPPEGSYDITIIGDWYISNEDNHSNDYDEIRYKELQKIKGNATKVIYGGVTDYTSDIGVPVYRWSDKYSYGIHNNFGFIQMTANNTGLIGKDSSQWNRFVADIYSSEKKDILIVIDKNPLKFTNKKEFELFHSVLDNVNNSGKRVFVVSTEGLTTEESIIDGIRYINLGSLFNNNFEKNSGFGTLRFRVTGDDIIYQIRN